MNLSVIIAIYNGQEYISRCLDSILAQKNITKEIIVVNDGSTDKTSDILNEYKHLKEIIIINQANAGQGVARNNGLKIANGKYITFVDADDFLLFDYTYDKLISRCEKEHLDMIIYRYNTLKNNQIIRTSIIEDDQRLYSSSEIINKFLCTNEVEGFCWNKIIKREIISKNQINFIPHKKYEDIPFVVCSILHCHRIKFDLVNAYNYIVNEASTTRLINYQTLVDEIDMIKLFISYIRGKYDDNFDEGISKYLNNRIKNFKKYRIKNLLKRRITFKEFLSIMIKYKELEELDKFY